MKTHRVSALRWTAALFVSTAFIVGCNSAGSPFASSQVGAAQSHRVRSLTDEATTVQVVNQENETIIGSYTPAPCWTISPLPIPTVSASPGVSPVITETYDTTCTQNTPKVTVAYNFGDGFAICLYTTTWSASRFTYSALGEQGHNQGNCSTKAPSSGAAIDQDFIFGIILDARRRHQQ